MQVLLSQTHKKEPFVIAILDTGTILDYQVCFHPMKSFPYATGYSGDPNKDSKCIFLEKKYYLLFLKQKQKFQNFTKQQLEKIEKELRLKSVLYKHGLKLLYIYNIYLKMLKIFKKQLVHPNSTIVQLQKIEIVISINN